MFGGGTLYLNGSTTLTTASGLFPTGVPTGAASYTVACWIKPTAENTGGWIGYGTNGVTNESNNFRLNGGSNNVWEYYYANDMGATMASGSLFDGNYHLVVGTYNSTTQTETIYIDGQNRASRTVTPDVVASNGATGFVIGKTLNDMDFTGYIDDLLISNQALTQAQVTSLYASGAVSSVSNVLPIGTALSIAASSTLDLDGSSQQVASLSDASPGHTAGEQILLGGGTLTVDSIANSSFSGALSGSGELVKSGSATLVLSGSDDYSGGTMVDSGLLEITDSDALPAGSSITVGAGGTLIFDPSATSTAYMAPGTPVDRPSAPSVVPEPDALALLLAGAASLGVWSRQRLFDAQFFLDLFQRHAFGFGHDPHDPQQLQHHHRAVEGEGMPARTWRQ